MYPIEQMLPGWSLEKAAHGLSLRRGGCRNEMAAWLACELVWLCLERSSW